jgi:hypothetical protein
MKIRNGFVSNSSSSSFIIISKNGELTLEKLMNAFDVNEKSPLYPLAKDVAKRMLDSDEMNAKSWKETWCYQETDEEFKEQLPEQYEIYEMLKEDNNIKVYYGSADSYDDAALCEMDIYYEDDDIKIEKDGGY